jgi:ABC-type multidrug transport system fused ATPase/permease subunit
MKNINNMHLENLRLSFKEICNYDKRLLFILLADIIINALLPFPNVILSGRIVDSIATGEDFLLVIFYVSLLFSTNYLFTAINTFLSKSKEYLFIKLTNKLDNEINQKCMNIDFENFNDSSIQDRILLINQAARGNNFFTSLTTVFETISRFLTLVGMVFIMTTLNVWLLSIALVVIVLQALLHFIRLKYDRKYKADSVHDQRKISYVSQLAKDISSKKDIVTFDMSDYILKKIESFQQEMLEFDKRRIQVGGIIEMAIYTLSVAFQVSAYILIGINAFNRTISIGDFTMGIASLINFMSVSSFVATNIINFNDSFFYIKQYKSFHKFKSKYDEISDITINDIDLNNIEIEFRNVSFRYPNSTSFVLKNINLTIKNAERLAIVGFNGAGKTSFVLLLTRMYDPTEGSIHLNGIDIRRINYRDYQKIFSTVNQDFSLFAFSLLNNIAKKDTATQEERDAITESFYKNGMAERLNKLYRGLDTPVTKTLSASGVDLSGGERQKIAIIRALYKDSPVLILDEPTSALDPVAEYEIYQKFAEMSEDKMTFFISHRIYSTRFCDKIAVFNKGEIVEYGTFEELQEQKGLYYDFFQKQAEYFK